MSLTEKIQGQDQKIAGIQTRIIALSPNDILYSALGEYVVFGCKVTADLDDTDMIVSLEGLAVGDESKWNPDVSEDPQRGFEYPNIASLKDGAYRSLDTTATVEAAPATGLGRYDIAYIYIGQNGAGFAIATGTPSTYVKAAFDGNGLDTEPYNHSGSYDPALPVGACPVARIYVEDDEPGIIDARIADIRPNIPNIGLSEMTELLEEAEAARDAAQAYASDASDSADAAAASQTAASGSASAAASSASAASGSASAAAASASAASGSASAASASASSASGSASAASASESAASGSATAASASATAAAASATAAAASYDSFDDRYLGPKSSDPTLDNDGNALLTGALYFNTVFNEMRAYSGSAWQATYLPAAAYLQLSGGTMTGNLLLAGTPSSNLMAATKLYVDQHAATINVKNYGAVGDGVTDDAAAFQAAIDYCASIGGGTVLAEGLVYAIGATLNIGNGSASQFSTINGILLQGVGSQDMRLDDGGSPLRAAGTRLKWIGAGSGLMVSINGPCYGNALCNIALNAADSAAYGLKLISASRGIFNNVTASDFTNTGVLLTVVAAETISGQSEGISTEGNIFNGLRIAAFDGGAGAIGLDIDGYLGSAANGWDSVRNHFTDTYITVHRTGGTGIRLAFTDQNTFDGVYMSGFGTSDGNQASIRFVGVATVPDAYTFPQNNVFIGNIDIGQNLPITASGTPGPGNAVDNMTLLDSQVVTRWPENKTVRSRFVEPGTFPKGGYWSEGGLMVLDRSFRNRLLNSTFKSAARGATFSGVSASQYTLDQWKLGSDGAVNIDISRQDFTLGQTDVPYEPKHFLRIIVNSASGATFLLLGQAIADVRTLEGRKTCLSAWLRVLASTKSVGGRIEQNFGTGGSPSATAATTAGTQTIDTTWRRRAFEMTPASITGKTVGSNGDDNMGIFLSLPLNTTFTLDIALPQWEAGEVDTAFEVRPDYIDAILCGQFIRKIGAGAAGMAFSSTGFAMVQPLSPPMFKAPTLTNDGSTITITVPGSGTATATASSSSANTSTHHAEWANSGFTGLTALRSGFCRTNHIYASAEF